MAQNLSFLANLRLNLRTLELTGDLGHSFLNTNSRLDDAHGTPGHRRGSAEEVLATNRKRGCLVQHRPIRFFVIQRWMEKTTGLSAMARLGNPVAHLSGAEGGAACAVRGVLVRVLGGSD
jgi:hypothetical protein